LKLYVLGEQIVWLIVDALGCLTTTNKLTKVSQPPVVDNLRTVYVPCVPKLWPAYTTVPPEHTSTVSLIVTPVAVTLPDTKLTPVITPPNESANSQLPEVCVSNASALDPVTANLNFTN